MTPLGVLANRVIKRGLKNADLLNKTLALENCYFGLEKSLKNL